MEEETSSLNYVIGAIVVIGIIFFLFRGEDSSSIGYEGGYTDQNSELEQQVEDLQNQVEELEECSDTLRSQIEEIVSMAEDAVGESYYDSQDALEEIGYGSPNC